MYILYLITLLLLCTLHILDPPIATKVVDPTGPTQTFAILTERGDVIYSLNPEQEPVLEYPLEQALRQTMYNRSFKWNLPPPPPRTPSAEVFRMAY